MRTVQSWNVCDMKRHFYRPKQHYQWAHYIMCCKSQMWFVTRPGQQH